MENMKSITCEWDYCFITIEGCKPFLRYLRHLLIHCHVARLMIEGDHERVRTNLPTCHLPRYNAKELLSHSLDVPRKCLWDECHFLTDDIDEYFIHVRAHLKRTGFDRGDPFVCRWDGCYDAMHNKVFRNSGNLKTHVIGHTKEKRVACSKCYRQFTAIETFRDHLVKQNPFCGSEGQKLHTCKECGETFTRRPQLTSHSRTHKEKVKCSFCVRTFSSPADLESHVLVKHVPKPRRMHKCFICTSVFLSRRRLLEHVKGEHQSSILQCSSCDFEAKEYSKLWRHYYREHEPRLYSCHVCGVRMYAPARLQLHLKKEHGVEPEPGYLRLVYERSADGVYQMKRRKVENSSVEENNDDSDDDCIIVE